MENENTALEQSPVALNPETGKPYGEAQAPQTEEALPPRSYSRTKSAANQWDAHFKFDGGTVYIKTLSKDDRAALQIRESEIGEQVKVLQEQLTGASDASERFEITEQMGDIQLGYMTEILLQTVRHWVGLPVAYSIENLKDLPLEMMTEWVNLIMQRSVLGSGEQEQIKNG